MPVSRLTRHAEVRASQRCFPHAVIDAVWTFGDCEEPAGGGCTAIRISRRRLQDHDLQSWLGTNWERAAGVTIIVADDGFLVTVYYERRSSWKKRHKKYN